MQQSVTCGSKNAKGVKKIVKKDDLSKLKLNVDQLDDDKLKNVSVDLKKLSDVVEKEVVKKLYLTN